MSSVEVLYLIENLREQLNTLALHKPLADPEVVNLSQLLDSYLNLYQRFYSPTLNILPPLTISKD
ncbi:aspartyl-phosphate phosphatase Spo0E family protein [Desulfosporosinus hippei]|uniref:aspartyl-phosphate phosphatase Spo0E family protein n=1 Tax=Desulfosporosinus hippei TaxID=569859 RepID=UPI000B86BCBD|nr:aspartyl-phosphate phosphatase Spo0E family protein [Desulfosporosinus hippei]